jgi:hypothetical protein
VEKDDWIKAKIAVLIKDGTAEDEKQAYAIALKMWNEDHAEDEKETQLDSGSKKKARELASEYGIKPIPILTTGKTKNGDDITKEMFADVLKSYDLGKHQAPVVDVPHDVEKGPAIGWVEELFNKKVDGKDWIFADIIPADEAGAKQLSKMLAGPMKFNSPEIELYEPDSTKEWAGKAQWMLRRVNMLGAQPPAQVGMPQAKLSDTKGKIKIFMCEMMSYASAWCPSCGMSYANDYKYCQMDGTELEHKKGESTMAEKPEEKKVEKAEPIVSAEIALAEKRVEEKFKIQLAESEKKNAETEKKFALYLAEQKEKDIKAEVADLITNEVITKACEERMQKVLMLADSEKRINLADSTEESLRDSILFIVNQPKPPKSGELTVMARKNAGKTLSFSDDRDTKISATAEKHKLDMTKSADIQRAIALAETAHPEIRIHQSAGGDK